MIAADTDSQGTRTYRVPRGLADVAVDLFSDMSQRDAVFHLARVMSWHDCHTLECIALNRSHADAVEFARARIEKSALAIRHIN
jgi:hypothetical protein